MEQYWSRAREPCTGADKEVLEPTTYCMERTEKYCWCRTRILEQTPFWRYQRRYTVPETEMSGERRKVTAADLDRLEQDLGEGGKTAEVGAGAETSGEKNSGIGGSAASGT